MIHLLRKKNPDSLSLLLLCQLLHRNCLQYISEKITNCSSERARERGFEGRINIYVNAYCQDGEKNVGWKWILWF